MEKVFEYFSLFLNNDNTKYGTPSDTICLDVSISQLNEQVTKTRKLNEILIKELRKVKGNDGDFDAYLAQLLAADPDTSAISPTSTENERISRGNSLKAPRLRSATSFSIRVPSFLHKDKSQQDCPKSPTDENQQGSAFSQIAPVLFIDDEKPKPAATRSSTVPHRKMTLSTFENYSIVLPGADEKPPPIPDRSSRPSISSRSRVSSTQMSHRSSGTSELKEPNKKGDPNPQPSQPAKQKHGGNGTLQGFFKASFKKSQTLNPPTTIQKAASNASMLDSQDLNNTGDYSIKSTSSPASSPRKESIFGMITIDSNDGADKS